MRARVLLVGACALLSAFGCGDKKEEKTADVAPAPAPATQLAPTPAPAAPPAARVAPGGLPVVPMQTVQIELGYEVDDAGSIPAALAAREFAAASPFVLAVRAPGAAADAEVTVRWLDERDNALATQRARFQAGRDFLDFTGPDTTTWRSGPYKAEVRIGDAAPKVLDFTIVRAGESVS